MKNSKLSYLNTNTIFFIATLGIALNIINNFTCYISMRNFLNAKTRTSVHF